MVTHTAATAAVPCDATASSMPVSPVPLAPATSPSLSRGAQPDSESVEHVGGGSGTHGSGASGKYEAPRMPAGAPEWGRIAPTTPRHPQRRLKCISLELLSLSLTQTSDLDGSTASELSVGSFALSARLDEGMGSSPGPRGGNGHGGDTWPGGGSRHGAATAWEWESGMLCQRVDFPLVTPLDRADLHGAPTAPIAALSLVHDSWPSSIGEWREGAPLRAARDSGSHLRVVVTPLSICVLPPVVMGLQALLERCEGPLNAQCGPLLPDTTVYDSTVSVTLGTSQLLFPCDNHVFELSAGPTEITMRAPAIGELVDDAVGGGRGGATAGGAAGGAAAGSQRVSAAGGAMGSSRSSSCGSLLAAGTASRSASTSASRSSSALRTRSAAWAACWAAAAAEAEEEEEEEEEEELEARTVGLLTGRATVGTAGAAA